MREAAVAAIERQIFFENANWPGAARPKLMGAKTGCQNMRKYFPARVLGPV